MTSLDSICGVEGCDPGATCCMFNDDGGGTDGADSRDWITGSSTCVSSSKTSFKRMVRGSKSFSCCLTGHMLLDVMGGTGTMWLFCSDEELSTTRGSKNAWLAGVYDVGCSVIEDISRNRLSSEVKKV